MDSWKHKLYSLKAARWATATAIMAGPSCPRQENGRPHSDWKVLKSATAKWLVNAAATAGRLGTCPPDTWKDESQAKPTQNVTMASGSQTLVKPRKGLYVPCTYLRLDKLLRG